MTDPQLRVADEAEALQHLSRLGPAKVVVGIPSFREADTIGHVVRQVDLGLREHLPGLAAVIINVDNASPDGTREAFEAVETETPKLYISTPPGTTGKGLNLWNLFVAARVLEARAVVCVDADLMSIQPAWVRDLAHPVLDGHFDQITPRYARNEYDGTITNHLCLPMLRGLHGTRVRQPIGGDFGLSRELVDHVLAQPWQPTTLQFGVDVFLTCRALFGGFRMAQTDLGAKIHKHSAPKLGPMFSQVVQTLFEALLGAASDWLRPVSKRDLPLLGAKPRREPQGLPIDYKAIRETTLEHYAASASVLERHLAPVRVGRVAAMIRSHVMHLPADLWCECAYDLFHAFAVVPVDMRPSIVEALKPLFFARVATFYKETLELDHGASEERIIEQAELFFDHRDGLLARFGARPDAESPSPPSNPETRYELHG